MVEKEKLAEALGVSQEILPYLSELLADLSLLGSWPEEIIELLKPLKLPAPLTRVLDLGCGKGSVSIPLAEKLKFQIRGVDLFSPFVKEARKNAKKSPASNLCKFEIGDMRDVLKERASYDIVIFASVGSVLGDFEECVGQLRKAVRPGGYMVIDDGFLRRARRLERPGYQHYRPHKETIRQLTNYGDKLIHEKIYPLSRLREFNQNTTSLIRRRAEILTEKNPGKAELFARYVRWEESECKILETETTWATWLLQRAG
ncbi:MAG: class I SAM-dependent methyltransferase [Calditrichaceae bacterium]